MSICRVLKCNSFINLHNIKSSIVKKKIFFFFFDWPMLNLNLSIPSAFFSQFSDYTVVIVSLEFKLWVILLANNQTVASHHAETTGCCTECILHHDTMKKWNIFLLVNRSTKQTLKWQTFFWFLFKLCSTYFSSIFYFTIWCKCWMVPIMFFCNLYSSFA